MVNEKNTICAVVVTYNRKELLRECLNAIKSQTLQPNHILVVDNASTDGTPEMLMEEFPETGLVRLEKNEGGSGGFHEGMKRAYEMGFDWIWVMDDDAIPDRYALEQLLSNNPDINNAYGSTAVSLNDRNLLCWPVQPINKKRTITVYSKLTNKMSVKSLPFLGLMIHSKLIQNIGLPRKNFFISCDDVEYCLRIKNSGSNIFLIKSSLIYHPQPIMIPVNLGFKTIYTLELSPWKRYYDIRNRILIAKQYFGFRLWSETLPGIVFRWFITLIKQDDKLAQCSAYYHGIKDGLLSKDGRLWQPGDSKYKK